MGPARLDSCKHEDFLKDKPRGTCRTCHGCNEEGTVLSRVAATRTLECKDIDLPAAMTIAALRCRNSKKLVVVSHIEL